jgi:hypothetical protein
VHGGHHAFQHRVEELASLLGVAVGQQLHRALEIGEQHGDQLAFALDGTLGGQDLFGEIAGRVAEEGLGARHERVRGRGLCRPSEGVPHSPQNLARGGWHPSCRRGQCHNVEDTREMVSV